MNEEDMVTIGDNAFQDFTKLSSVRILDSVKSIGKQAFSGCNNLSSIDLGSGLSSIKSNAFDNCSKLQNFSCQNNLLIGNSIFRNCSSLTSVSLPNAEQDKANDDDYMAYIFSKCHNLKEVVYGGSGLGRFAFENCSSLTSVVCDNLSTIGDIQEAPDGSNGKTFFNCRKLSSINLDGVVQTGGPWLFANCSSLTSVSFPELIRTSHNNSNGIGSYNMFENCTSLQTASFPKLSSTAKEYMFKNCTNLTSVYFPEIRRVTTSTFSGCSGLPFINLPKAVSIDAYAFYNCSSLSAIILSGADEVPTLERTEIFTNCPEPVSVYVKDQNMVDMFLADDKWYTLSSNGTIDIIPVETEEETA